MTRYPTSSRAVAIDTRAPCTMDSGGGTLEGWGVGGGGRGVECAYVCVGGG